MNFKLNFGIFIIFSILYVDINAASLPHLKKQQQLTQAQQQQQHAQNNNNNAVPSQRLSAPNNQAASAYNQEKNNMAEDIKSINSEEDLNEHLTDPYQILSEYKPELRLPQVPFGSTWNPYVTPHNYFPFAFPPPSSNGFESMFSGLHTPKFLPFFGYAQPPVFVPYPLYVSPEMMFSNPLFANNEVAADFEDTMSRARRPGASSQASGYRRNSPIYYVRLPPTPYMFLPNLPSTSSSFGILPTASYQPVPSFTPSFSSIFNLPVNFLANGKPSGIYQIGASAPDIQQQLPLQFENNLNGFSASRPLPINPYNPSTSNNNYGNNFYNPANGGSTGPTGFGLTSSTNHPIQDSKMTSLKRPFIFNGRPDDIYILPNSFNPLYTENAYY